MYSHGPHMDVTDLELSPIVGIASDKSRGLKDMLANLGDKGECSIKDASQFKLSLALLLFDIHHGPLNRPQSNQVQSLSISLARLY